MHWFKRVSEMQLLHLGVYSVVGFSFPVFQSCLEWKSCHNRCYDVWMFLFHFHKEHLCIQIDQSMIFQLGYNNCIFRACHSGYIIFFIWDITPEDLLTTGIYFERSGCMYYWILSGATISGTCSILVVISSKGPISTLTGCLMVWFFWSVWNSYWSSW